MAQMTQITAKAFATEDTEITENSKGIGFRGNGYSPAFQRGVLFVPDYNCAPPLQAGLWGSAMAGLGSLSQAGVWLASAA